MARRAVLVGVDNYFRPEIPDLNGCVNDVRLIRDVLKSYFGFGNDEIRVLVNDRATKAAIVHRLEEMVGQAREGDLLVFHFSGHGSQIRDRNYDESLSDHLDELICPHDMNWNNGYITDDDLERIFHGLREGVLLEAILDCCHSGTAVEAPEVGPPVGLESGQTRLRFVEPPVDIAARADGDEDFLKKVTFCSCLRTLGQPYVFWAAAAEDEIAAEDNLGDAVNGVFTYYLASYLDATAGHASREELLAAVSELIQTAGYTQHPQLASEEVELGSQPLGGEAVRPVWTPFDL